MTEGCLEHLLSSTYRRPWAYHGSRARIRTRTRAKIRASTFWGYLGGIWDLRLLLPHLSGLQPSQPYPPVEATCVLRLRSWRESRTVITSTSRPCLSQRRAIICIHTLGRTRRPQRSGAHLQRELPRYHQDVSCRSRRARSRRITLFDIRASDDAHACQVANCGWAMPSVDTNGVKRKILPLPPIIAPRGTCRGSLGTRASSVHQAPSTHSHARGLFLFGWRMKAHRMALICCIRTLCLKSLVDSPETRYQPLRILSLLIQSLYILGAGLPCDMRAIVWTQ